MILMRRMTTVATNVLSYIGCFGKIASILTVSGASMLVIHWLSQKSRYFRKFRLVGRVSSLHCYPVSTCTGMMNNLVTCTTMGMKMIGAYDQEFIIGRPADTTFATSSPKGTIKQYFRTSMRRLRALCNGRDLLLSSPDGDTFTVPLKVAKEKSSMINLHCAENIVSVRDLGDVVAKWLNKKLEASNLRLYQVHSQVACVRPGRRALGNYIFAIQESVDYINNTIDVEPSLTTLYFRPNIVISGCSPLEETSWSYIEIGKVSFEVTAPDSRIISTSSNPDNIDWKPAWELPPELPNNVHAFNGANFTANLGINAKVLVEGEISVGDPVYAAY